ncbi:glycosyltransferase family protein, partial [Autumnicola edwardsiae]
TPERAKKIGEAAYKKVLEKHTYEHRAELLESVISRKLYGEAKSAD